MLIWTIQNETAWDYLCERGSLQATRCRQSGNWPEAYEWMGEQLASRVGPPPHGDAAPLWGWSQWKGEERIRPDLRAVRHSWNPPGRYVLLACELPDADVMLSDFDAWHVVLNSQYLGITDEEENAFAAARREYDLHPNEERAAQLRRIYRTSWERIIDMDVLTEPDWHAPENKSIQACFWQVGRDQVKSCKRFSTVGRAPR